MGNARGIKLDPEFKGLLPPLATEEYEGLEQSLITEGCRDPLVLWQGTLIDGYNRYALCQKHDIEFRTVPRELESREDAKVWIIQNHFSRRNLSLYQRTILACRLESIFRVKAKEHQRLSPGPGVKGWANSPNLNSPIHTRDEIAKVAGVSSNTVSRVQKVEAEATQEQKERLERGEASINEVYKEIKNNETQTIKLFEDDLPPIPEYPDDVLNNIVHGDALAVLETFPDDSVDCLVTDPPYGYSFMGKDWDTFNESTEYKESYHDEEGSEELPVNVAGEGFLEFFVPVWKECLRVLKAGGFAFVMASPRQDILYKQISALDQAGFDIGFTSIYWTYASGFPKASNIGKMIDKRLGNEREVIGKEKIDVGMQNGSMHAGRSSKIVERDLTRGNSHLEGSYGGFQPKPAVEVILVAMKPLLEKTYVDQAMRNGKGITWLDDCRIPYESEGDKYKEQKAGSAFNSVKGFGVNTNKGGKTTQPITTANQQGRFPANLLVSNDVLGEYSKYFNLDTFPFVIVPKASKREKNGGLEGFEKKEAYNLGHKDNPGRNAPKKSWPRANHHPTVKPLKLMSYLITLGSREGDIILDPFVGSGATCIASKQLNRKYIGIEKGKEYFEIAQARLKQIGQSIIPDSSSRVL